MKIRLPKHKIEQRTQDDLINDNNRLRFAIKEIPLGYINTDEISHVPTIHIEDDFQQQKRKLVRPYDVFMEEDPYFFDSKNNPVIGTMKRSNNVYVYEPRNSTEFVPLTFTVYCEIQKQMKYYNDQIYDISVSVSDSTSDMSFCNNLLSIFGDKYLYGDCPPNIRINSGSTIVESLIQQDFRYTDFVFVQSHDGIHLGDSVEDSDIINVDYILGQHTNLWISCSGDYQGRFTTAVSPYNSSSLNMNQTVLYDTTEYTISSRRLSIFDQNVNFIEGQTYNDIPMYINEAALILHRSGKGFVIVTPSWFLEEKLDETYRMVYEIMMYCYLNSYYKSREVTFWISDIPIDYLAYHNNRYGMCHNLVKIDDLLLDYDLHGMYTVKDIVISTPYVRYLGLSQNKELLFKKTNAEPDPIKHDDEYSFYTTKHSIIHYKQEDIYTIEKPMNIEFMEEGTTTYIIVHPYISTQNRVRTTTDQTFKITDYNKKYILYVGKGSSNIENTFYLLLDTEIPDTSYSRVASISFEAKDKPLVCDTRILGGGLPDDQTDEYDMLDIGHPFGRPYRLGSTLIIRLPKIAEVYKDRISKELDKHISAGDEYTLVFEASYTE